MLKKIILQLIFIVFVKPLKLGITLLYFFHRQYTSFRPKMSYVWKKTKKVVSTCRLELFWLLLFGISNFTLRWIVWMYYINLWWSYWNLFLNKLILLLTVESVVVYRYFLTFQFVCFLSGQVILMIYHGIRRFFVDLRHSFAKKLPPLFLECFYLGILILGFSTGLLLEIGNWKKHVGYLYHQVVNKLLDWTTVFYYTFSVNLHSLLNAIYQSRELRFLRAKKGIHWFVTLDELYFGCAGVYRLIKSLATVRMQDMYIPELIELGYPISWGPKDQLVKSVYDSGSYFFWACHSHLDQTLVPLLQKYHFIPYDLLATEQKPTAHLQVILEWIESVQKTGELNTKHDLFLNEVLNEIYFAFHDHFRLVVLDHLQTDPFFLVRLFCSEKFRCYVENPGLDYLYNSDPFFQKNVFSIDYLLDIRILERVCEHWEFVKYADQLHSRLISPYRSELLALSSQKKKSKILGYESTTTWGFWQSIYENCLYYFQAWIECYHAHSLFPTRYFLGNVTYNKEPYFDNVGWTFPVYSLQGVPYQDNVLFLCIAFYAVVSAFYIYTVCTPENDDPLIYHEWYFDFNKKCQYLLGIKGLEDGLEDPEFAENIYWLTMIALIPAYWVPKERPYYRRRFRTSCDIEYMRYIRRAARLYQSADPLESDQVDYFTWQFFEALSPLFPIRDKEAMSHVHKKRYRHQLTFYQQQPSGYHNPGKVHRIWQQRFRKYARHLLTNGLGFLEQDWMFSYYRWEYTLMRYRSIPGPTVQERYTHPEYLREYFRYMEMYIPWKRLSTVNYATKNKRNDLRYKLSMIWRAGLWRKNEVRSVSQRVRPVSMTQIQKQLEYKKLIERALAEMLPPKPPRISVQISAEQKLFADKRFFRIKPTTEEAAPKYFKPFLQPPFTTLQQFWLSVGKKVTPPIKYEREPLPPGLPSNAGVKSKVKINLKQHEKTPQRWVDTMSHANTNLRKRPGKLNALVDYYLQQKVFVNNEPDQLKKFYPFPKFDEEHWVMHEGKYTITGDSILSETYGKLPRTVYQFFHFLKCLPPILQVGPVDGAIANDEIEIARISALIDMQKFLEFKDEVKRDSRVFLKVSSWLKPAEDEWNDSSSPKQRAYKPLMPYLFTAPTFPAQNLVETDFGPLLKVTVDVRTRKKERYETLVKSVTEFNRLVNMYDSIVLRLHRQRQLPLFVLVWDPSICNIRFVVDKEGIEAELERREQLRLAQMRKFEPRKLLNDVNLIFFTEQVICPPLGQEDSKDNLDLQIHQTKRGIRLSVGHLVWDTILHPDIADVNYFPPNQQKPFIAQNSTFVVRSVPIKQIYYSLPRLWKRVLNYFIYDPLARWEYQLFSFAYRHVQKIKKRYSSLVNKYPFLITYRAYDLSTAALTTFEREETDVAYLRRNAWYHSSIVMDGFEWSSVYDSFMEAMYGSSSSWGRQNCNLHYFDNKGQPVRALPLELDTDDGWLDDIALYRRHRANVTLRNRNDWYTGYLRPDITRDYLMECLFYQPLRSFAISAHTFDFTKEQQLVALEDWYDFDTNIFAAHPYLRREHLITFEGESWNEQYLEAPVRVTLHPLLTITQRRKNGPPDCMFDWQYSGKLRTYKVGQPLTQELVKAFLNPIRDESRFASSSIESESVKRRLSLMQRMHTRARPSEITEKTANILTVNDPLALVNQIYDTARALPESHFGEYLSHRITKQTQHALGNAYWRLLKQWSTPQNRREFAFRSWLRIPPEMEQYFNLHQDRITFLRDMNLSFSASNYERYEQARLKDWSHFRDAVKKRGTRRSFRVTQWAAFQNKFNGTSKPHNVFAFGPVYDKENKKSHLNWFYRQMYLRYFAPGAFWESYFSNKYVYEKKKINVPLYPAPQRLMHINDILEYIKDPSERLDMVFKLMEKHNINRDHPAMMDFFFNDLSQTLEAYVRERPSLSLTEEANLLEMSLPGTIVSPREIRFYWDNYTQLSKKTVKLAEFYKYLHVATGAAKLYKKDPGYSVVNIDAPVRYRQNTFFIPDRTQNWYRHYMEWSQLSEWNKWSWLFGCAGMLESEQLAFYLFCQTPLRTGLSGWQSKTGQTSQEDIPTVTADTLTADLEQFPLLKSFDDKMMPYITFSRQLINVPGLEHDDLYDYVSTSTFYPFPTGYLRTNASIEEDRTTGEYLRATGPVRGTRKTTQQAVARRDWKYQQQVRKLKGVSRREKRAIESTSNAVIFADTPDSFVEFRSREYLFNLERRRLLTRYRDWLDTKFNPVFQKYLRDNKTRQVFFQKHFSYFFDMIRKDWLFVTITPSMADEVMKEFLLPELEILRQTLKTSKVKCGVDDLTKPELQNYRTAYIFDIVPSLVEHYENKEFARRHAKRQWLQELTALKWDYIGRYYNPLRDKLMDSLRSRLEKLPHARYCETGKNFWHNGGSGWETRLLSDWFITIDTLNEVETRDPIMNYEKESRMAFLNFYDFDVSFSGMGYMENYVPGLDYWDYYTTAFNQDWVLHPERFPIRGRNVMRGYVNDHICLYYTYVLPRFKRASQVIQKSELANFEKYPQQLTLRFLNRGTYGDQMLEKTRFTLAAQHVTSFIGQTAWFLHLDVQRALGLTVHYDQEGPPFRVEYFTAPNYWFPWYSTKDTLSTMKNDFLLIGLYNVTQLSLTPIQFFTQFKSGGYGGIFDLYGIQCGASRGLAPFEWYDLYDPISNRIIEVLPNFDFIFKEGKMFRRYFGYYMPQTVWERVIGPWSVVDNIESITSGYTDLESSVGVELAVTQTLYQYFGVLPHNIIEFLTYATYWGYTWINAIYNGSFVESHIEKLNMMTPQDGLLEVGLTGKEYDECLRQLQLKILTHPEIDYDKIFADLLKAQELKICNTYFFGYFPYHKS